MASTGQASCKVISWFSIKQCRQIKSTHLTESTVNTLGHVNVVAGRASASISALFSLDCDGLSWADGLAKLACDATFFSTRVPSEGVLATESGAKGSFLEWVVDGGRLLEDVGEGHSEATEQLGEENSLGCAVSDVLELHALLFFIHVDPCSILASVQRGVNILVVRSFEAV